LITGIYAVLKNSVHGVYEILSPAKPIPLVFDSPHSGREYPENFNYSCEFNELQQAEDNMVDELFSEAPASGTYLLHALFPRTYIDVNRSLHDIDHELLCEPWPEKVLPSSRAHSGIGLIRRLLKPGILVYDRKLSVSEINARINDYYMPYHDALDSLLSELHYKFGQVWHVNCHSMPSDIISGQRVDFVLGDRDGTSCDLEFTHALRDHLVGAGYRVNINNPYKGVELINRYSAPSRGRHSLQIEINKALYWNEAENRKTSHYADLKSEIDKLITFCADFVDSRLVNLAAD
jgi:N-formylglutamate amidohydrolase